MGHENPKYVCYTCIDDKVLAQQVEKAGTHTKCSYCHVANGAIITVLSDRIHQVMEEHFEPITTLLKSGNIELEPGVDLRSHLSSYLEGSETVIGRIAGLKAGIAAKLQPSLLA